MKYLTSMILVAAFACSGCYAAEIMNDGDPAEAPTMTLKGHRPAKLEIVSGFGKNIPLMEAVKLIAPKEVAPVFDDVTSTENPKVTWHGGESWIATLSGVFRQSRTSGVMNFDTMRLDIGSSIKPKSVASPVPPVPSQMVILSIHQNPDAVTITLAAPVSEIYIVDRVRQQDVIVNWVTPTSFSFPASIADKIRITTSKGTSNIVRTGGQWIMSGS